MENYYMLNITFRVYVSEAENQLNYKVNETRLVEALSLAEAERKIKNYIIPRHENGGHKIFEETISVKDLTIR